MSSRILFISGHRADALRISRMVRGLHMLLDYASGVKQACQRLRSTEFSAVVTEAALPDGSWVDILNATREISTKVIVTDPKADARLWAEALNLGAYDLLSQPFYEPEVRRVLNSVCTRLAASGAAG